MGTAVKWLKKLFSRKPVGPQRYRARVTEFPSFEAWRRLTEGTGTLEEYLSAPRMTMRTVWVTVDENGNEIIEEDE